MDPESEFYCLHWAQTHATIAEDMYRAMATLKGFWIKLGQYRLATLLTDLTSLTLARSAASARIRTGPIRS